MLSLCWFALTLSALSMASPIPDALSPLLLAERDSKNELVARAPGYCPLVDEIVNRARAFVDVTPFCSSLLQSPTATATSVSIAAATSLTTKTVPTTVVSTRTNQATTIYSTSTYQAAPVTTSTIVSTETDSTVSTVTIIVTTGENDALDMQRRALPTPHPFKNDFPGLMSQLCSCLVIPERTATRLTTTTRVSLQTAFATRPTTVLTTTTMTSSAVTTITETPTITSDLTTTTTTTIASLVTTTGTVKYTPPPTFYLQISQDSPAAPGYYLKCSNGGLTISQTQGDVFVLGYGNQLTCNNGLDRAFAELEKPLNFGYVGSSPLICNTVSGQSAELNCNDGSNYNDFAIVSGSQYLYWEPGASDSGVSAVTLMTILVSS